MVKRFKMKKLKKYWCFLFHRKLWHKEYQYSNDFFEYQLYYCPKCEWYFYDNPFDQEEK